MVTVYKTKTIGI